MDRNKLTELLEKLSAREFGEFGKFVRSPYHNESLLLLRLYDHLVNYHPDYGDKNLTKESIFSSVYPAESYNDKKLRDRFSDLSILAEEFLVISRIRKNPDAMRRLKLDQFSQRKLDLNFERTIEEIGKRLERSNVRNADHFLELYEMISIRREYYEFRKPIGKRIEFFKTGEIEVYHFALYFTYKMLKYYITMQNQEKHIKHKYQYSFLEHILSIVEENKFDDHPVIKLFYFLIQIRINNSNLELFNNLKELSFEYLEMLDNEDKIMVLAELYNYCHFKFTGGDKTFRYHQFEIIKLMLAHKAYPQNDGYMTELHFINTVSVPLSINQLSWAESFLENNKDILPKGNKYNAYYISQCYLYVEKKDYNSALNVLSKVTGDDFFYHLHLKNQYCKIYFELKEYEMVISVIDSFKNYLSTNQMIPEHFRLPFGNFISVLKKLVGAILDEDEFMIHKTGESIDSFKTGTLMNTDWLKLKLNELKP